MKRLIERSALLRPMNYLRVHHPYALRYNLIYPAIAATSLAMLVSHFSLESLALEKDGLAHSLAPFLAVLSPFYIAALAAVSTFQGPKAFDRPFKMSSDVCLYVLEGEDVWRKVDVTPRYFLSLLFGYCTVISLILLFVSLFAPLLCLAFAIADPKYGEWLRRGFFFFYIFLGSQLTISTLLGVYYLSDKIHRP